jgi:hypothetical protein
VALVAKALGLEQETAARLKVLGHPEGLRAVIVQKAFGLPLKKNQLPAKLRAQLAVVALERAFGNKIKAGFGSGSVLSAKAGRLLAGQLSQSPRDYGTDSRLIAQLAAERTGATQSDLDDLRLAILRGLFAKALDSGTRAPQVARPIPPPANDAGPSGVNPSARPDLAGFAVAVQRAARSCAEGWPGSRRAFISQVWQAIRAANPAWSLSEIEFKCMLAEAHRLGRVVLATADLKDKKDMAQIESSAILYKNTIWHFVRVED